MGAQVTVQKSIICFGGLRIIELVLPLAPRQINAIATRLEVMVMESWSHGRPPFFLRRTGGNDDVDIAKIVVQCGTPVQPPSKKIGEESPS